MDALLNNEAARARMALIWKRRAVGEHEATARFAAYAERLRAVGAPQGFQDQAFESSEQELRHRELCLDMAHRLRSGEIVFQDRDFSRRPPATPADVLVDMVALGCVVETINVAHLSTSLRNITEPELRRATRKILADEVKHSRLGWAYLTWARVGGEGDGLAEQVPQMLWEAVTPDIFADAPPHPEQALLRAMGDPPMPARRALFVQTVTDVILPGLEASGISGEPARAWLANPTWPTAASSVG